ncbi:hypothetical protein JAAARDRAFT_211829 [Jaapia argillacea MUCL 33604]|uniref:F-box domain-containing protein n=1 Tax=Jaapia argillacea MUCL 33604 TaxID=933084 RepID=A0A067P8T0_9AGAM|nr:hypothetical protein JAAARDRAFT_211829 [Jaapia argillacea MUCL 33604]
MAFHPVLRSNDLLLTIFGMFVDQFHRNSTLAACALCCRAWREPAEMVLWSELSSHTPLLKLLPVHEVDWMFCLQRRITSPEFGKFKKFARRVRELTVDDTTIPMHASLSFCISHLSNGEILFPSLRRLDFTIFASRDYASPLFFLSPSIVDLRVRTYFRPIDGGTNWNDSYVGALFDVLGASPKGTSGLRELTLFVELTRDFPQLAEFKNLRGLRLREIHISKASDLFHQLPTLPNLADLSFSVQNLHLADGIDGVRLRSLESLGILGPFSTVTKVLHLLSAPKLETLDVSEGSGTMLDWRMFFTTVTTRFSPSLL